MLKLVGTHVVYSWGDADEQRAIIPVKAVERLLDRVVGRYCYTPATRRYHSRYTRFISETCTKLRIENPQYSPSQVMREAVSLYQSILATERLDAEMARQVRILNTGKPVTVEFS